MPDNQRTWNDVLEEVLGESETPDHTRKAIEKVGLPLNIEMGAPLGKDRPSVPMPRDMSRQIQVDALTRSSAIFGGMLDTLSERYAILAKPAVWITRLSRMLWGAVEIAVPRSITGILMRHWLRLLLLVSILLIVIGIVPSFGSLSVSVTGLKLLGLALLCNALVWTIIDFVEHRRQRVVAIVIFLAIALFVPIVALTWIAAPHLIRLYLWIWDDQAVLRYGILIWLALSAVLLIVLAILGYTRNKR
jgi:hypothetical protein